MASAKRGSKKNSAKKATRSSKKTSKKTSKKMSKKTPTGMTSAKKKAPTKKVAGQKRASKRARNVAIAAGVGVVAAGAAAVAIRRRRVSTAFVATCTITNRGQVSGIVLDVIAADGFPGAGEASRFPDDVPANANRRKTWAVALRKDVSDLGCKPGLFGPADCASAKKVGDIVDALWAAIKKANGIA